MKVKIKKWDAVATWRWDLPEDDVCGICQNHFDGTCPACRYPGDDCSLCQCLFALGWLLLCWNTHAVFRSVWQMRPQLPYGESPLPSLRDNSVLFHALIAVIALYRRVD